MASIELSISENYVTGWSKFDAIRELLQNNIDQQIINPENQFYEWYRDGVFVIGSSTSSLDRSTLLLGASSKANDNRTIGVHGEGYKLALLVLTRLGHKVTINNYKKKEVWEPEISLSKKFKVPVLKINISRKIFTSVPDGDLEFHIEGLTKDEYNTIVSNTLQMQQYEVDNSEHIKTPFGTILLDDEYKQKLYVNGLFICTNKSIKYGYSFIPSEVKLDRDRSLIGDFDVRWASSKMWKSAEDTHLELITKEIIEGTPDVEYINNHTNKVNHLKLADKVDEEFVAKYGEEAIPVTSQDEADKVKAANRSPIFVSETAYTAINNSSSYQHRITSSPVYAEKITPNKLLTEFFDKYSGYLPEDGYAELKNIVDKSNDWESNE